MHNIITILVRKCSIMVIIKRRRWQLVVSRMEIEEDATKTEKEMASLNDALSHYYALFVKISVSLSR